MADQVTDEVSGSDIELSTDDARAPNFLVMALLTRRVRLALAGY